LEWGNIVHYLQGSPIDLLWHKSNAGVEPLHDLGIDDRHVIDRFVRFLDEREATQRFVGLVQTRATHVPFHSPEERQPFGDGSEIDLYDNSIAYVDYNEERVFDALRSRALLDETVIISMADHGEALGEHGPVFCHFLLDDPCVHVPLVIALPGVIPENEVRADLCSMVDLLPTFLGLLGLSEALSTTVFPTLHGRDLFAEGLKPAEALFADDGVKLFMVRTLNLKALITQEGDVRNVFDLASDPKESRNAGPEFQPKVDDALRRFHQFKAQVGETRYNGVAMDSEGRLEKLKSLGYTE